MPLDQTLGTEDLGLFVFPKDEITKAFNEHATSPTPPFIRDLLVANVAELAAFSGIKREPGGPYVVPPGAASSTVYKTNTLTYTCGIHKGRHKFKSEYIFLFSSDCWKLREILNQEPDKLLLSEPSKVFDTVRAAPWRFSASATSENDLRVTILLWALKAKILNELDETRAEWSPIVRELTRALGIELASSGHAAAY
jgi:hypothetical protein